MHFLNARPYSAGLWPLFIWSRFLPFMPNWTAGFFSTKRIKAASSKSSTSKVLSSSTSAVTFSKSWNPLTPARAPVTYKTNRYNVHNKKKLRNNCWKLTIPFRLRLMLFMSSIDWLVVLSTRVTRLCIRFSFSKRTSVKPLCFAQH